MFVLLLPQPILLPSNTLPNGVEPIFPPRKGGVLPIDEGSIYRIIQTR